LVGVFFSMRFTNRFECDGTDRNHLCNKGWYRQEIRAFLKRRTSRCYIEMTNEVFLAYAASL